MTWNINGEGPAKVGTCVERLRPDILLAAECTNPAPWPWLATHIPTSTAFIGVTGKTGLSALAFGDYSLRLVDEIYDPGLVRIAPLEVDRPMPFKLLAVWADNSTSRRPAIEALDSYAGWLADGDVVVAGDFNDGPQWDEPGHPLRWSALVQRLSDLGLVRAPSSSSATFYMYRHIDKPFVVDYVFVPERWAVRGVQVGSHEDWTDLSDHMPLIIDVEVPTGC